MYSEEGYHIGSGRNFLKELAVNATEGSGKYSINDIQRALNVWYPRGIEMFGNERGGETSIAFGFKDRNNLTAQSGYTQECTEVVELTNVAIVQTIVRGTSAPDARVMVREIMDTGDEQQGVRLENLLYVPDQKFFRSRGMEEIIFLPYDVRGTLITEGGRPIASERYLDYLQSVLPSYYLSENEFKKYAEALLGRERMSSGSYGW